MPGWRMAACLLETKAVNTWKMSAPLCSVRGHCISNRVFALGLGGWFSLRGTGTTVASTRLTQRGPQFTWGHSCLFNFLAESKSMPPHEQTVPESLS